MDVKFSDFAYDAKNSVTLTCMATLTYRVGFLFGFFVTVCDFVAYFCIKIQ